MKKQIEYGFDLDNNIQAEYTLVYDQKQIDTWAVKCLETLKAVGKIKDSPQVKLSSADVCNFACISFGGEYELISGKLKHSSYPGGSFVSEIYYKELSEIVGVNQYNEVDITNLSKEKELEIIKTIMYGLWKEYKNHV